MKSTLLFIAATLLLLAACQSPRSAARKWLVESPAGDRYCQIDTAGATIIPNGRIVQPMGRTVRIAPHPFGLALSKNGDFAVTANSGNRPFSITILENPTSAQPKVRQVPEGALDDKNLLEDVFMGLAIAPDDRSVWVAGGQANKIYRFDLRTGAKLDSIDCGKSDNPAFAEASAGKPDGYLGDLVLTRNGSTIYVCDQSNFQLLVVDTRSRKVLHRVAVGRYPFGVTLSPDEKSAYVANVGMFEYSPLRGLDEKNLKATAPDFPTAAYGSKEMREGYKTDRYEVPALGDPNAPESFSVWAVDVSGVGRLPLAVSQQPPANGQQPTANGPAVTHRIKTGFLVGEKIEGIPAVGGAGPNSLVANDRFVFVTNGNNDCVSVIDPKQGKVVDNIFLKPLPQLAQKRGVIPFGLALSPDGKRLYVAESGLNAVAVVDVSHSSLPTPRFSVLGHLPVGWFPSKLAVSPDGKKLIVANAKGYGSGPNGGYTFREGPEGSYVGHLMHGSVTVLDIPADADLPKWTQQVLDNNFKVQAIGGEVSSRTSNYPPIKHIVFISKENRTYDDVFGQVKKGKGDPDLARYGYNRTFSNKAKTQRVEGATVMPNHLALAQRFGISDNFYVDADHSADGHRWLANTYPNEWLETSVPAQYGSSRNVKQGSKAKGQYAWTGGAGAIFPEDYNEAGSLWDHLERNKISFYNFGFGTEMGSNFTDSTMKYYGQKVLVNFPMPGPLYGRSSQRYATFNMAIPDQFRADVFMQEFQEKWLNPSRPPQQGGAKAEKMPQVLTLMLPQDHGAGDRAEAGYPFRESYMADNDLALGRVVEFLSRTPYWKNMAIVVTEDDAQDGHDHVDAHRSVLMVISPYAKRNHVSHAHTSFGSIFKTFWNVLGVPCLNQYDCAATDLRDFFTETPDFTPFSALPEDPRVLDPKKLLTPFDAKFDWKSLLESPKLDNVEDFIREKRQ